MKSNQVISYYLPHIGGMEYVANEIINGLIRKDNLIEVFTSNIGAEKNKLRSTKNLKINYLKSWEFAHTPIIPYLFPKLLNIPKDSIIHVHISQPLTPEIVWLVSKLRKIPYVAHFHGNTTKSGKLGFLLPIYKKALLKRSLLKADVIITPTEEYKSFLKDNYGCKNILVIPNGVSKDFFINKKMTKIKMANLLFVGRLSAEKNVDKIINAVSLLKNKATLHIVGDGEKRAELERQIKNKSLDNVILHGFKSAKDLINLYKKADIFLLASDSEGQPLVLLEAMASGTPIIASDVRGIHELANDFGILVSPPTAENFAKEIDKLIVNKKLRKKMSNLGKEKAKQFTWEKVVDKLEEVYREVLNEHKNKSQ